VANQLTVRRHRQWRGVNGGGGTRGACLPDLAVAAAFNSEQSFFAVGVREMHQWNNKNA
jgi:hypothetical protein